MKPSRDKRRNRTPWRVTVPAVHSGAGGKRRDHYFQTKQEAVQFAQCVQDDIADGNWAWYRLPRPDRRRVIRCLDRLGWDVGGLESAVDQYQPTADARDMTVPDLVKECLAAKEAAGLRPRSIAQLRSTLNQFGFRFGVLPITSVTAGKIAEWLTSHDWSPETRRGKLVDVRTLFAFAVKNGYLPRNPADGVERPRSDDKPPGILTPDQLRAVITATRDIAPELLPWLAVQAYGGLRPSEAHRLAWRDVSAEYVQVRTEVSKTRQRRLVSRNPAMDALLAAGGDLPVTEPARRWRRIRCAAGLLADWPHDGLRHSFASYHLALHQSPDKTAHELGHHSTQMLFRHYRELVTEAAAREWFEPVEFKSPGASIHPAK